MVMKHLLILIILLLPTICSADLTKDEMVPEIRNYPKPLLCDLIGKDGKVIDTVILPWAMLEKIDEGDKTLVFKKDGKEIRIGPNTSYTCRRLLGD